MPSSAGKRLGRQSEHCELDDRPAALWGLARELELRLIAPPPDDLPNRMGRNAAARTPVAADDQPATGRDGALEQSLHQLAPPLLGRVDELRPHEIEPPRRIPLERVAEKDPVGPLRQA